MRLCGVIGFRRSRYLSLAREIDVKRTRALYTLKKQNVRKYMYLVDLAVCVCVCVSVCWDARARVQREQGVISSVNASLL